MNKFKTLSVATTLVASSAFAGQASALLIDFTDASKWGNPVGSNSTYSTTSSDANYGSLQVIVSAAQGSLDNPVDITWEQQDGFGVFGEGDNGNWDDDIENTRSGTSATEYLAVDFTDYVTISSIRVSDFLGTGQYSTGGSWTTFGPGSNVNGPGQTFAISSVNTNRIVFRAIENGAFQLSGLNLNTDVEVAPVPVPPAVWLLGSAMMFLMRKRQVS